MSADQCSDFSEWRALLRKQQIPFEVEQHSYGTYIVLDGGDAGCAKIVIGFSNRGKFLILNGISNGKT
jgi:hypothetical protein